MNEGTASPINWSDKLYDWGWELLVWIVFAAFGWIFYIERKIAGLRLHVSENYVKKTDLAALETRIDSKFTELKDGQDQILDLLLRRKIGTTARRR